MRRGTSGPRERQTPSLEGVRKRQEEGRGSPGRLLAVAAALLLAAAVLYWAGLLDNGRNEWVRKTHRVAMDGLDAKWLDILRHGEITDIRSVHSKAAFARKARVFFGHRSKSAIVKLIRRQPEGSLEPGRWREPPAGAPAGGVAPAVGLPQQPICHVGIGGVHFQGWAEIPAWHVDRLLEINLKPPTVGRVFDRAELCVTAVAPP